MRTQSLGVSRLLCCTDSSPDSVAWHSRGCTAASSPSLISCQPSVPALPLRTETHPCVLRAALPSCLPAQVPLPGAPPSSPNALCQPAFGHHEGLALSWSQLCPVFVPRHSAWRGGCFVFATWEQERMLPFQKVSTSA